MLLVGAVARLARIGAADPAPTPPLGKALAALGAAAVAGAIALAVLALPVERPGLGPDVARDLAASGVENPVTAVLIVFRGYDTLIESIVLLAALVGVWGSRASSGRGGLPAPRQHAAPMA